MFLIAKTAKSREILAFSSDGFNIRGRLITFVIVHNRALAHFFFLLFFFPLVRVSSMAKAFRYSIEFDLDRLYQTVRSRSYVGHCVHET